jgi:hypothetical protein
MSQTIHNPRQSHGGHAGEHLVSGEAENSGPDAGSQIPVPGEARDDTRSKIEIGAVCVIDC